MDKNPKGDQPKEIPPKEDPYEPQQPKGDDLDPGEDNPINPKEDPPNG